MEENNKKSIRVALTESTMKEFRTIVTDLFNNLDSTYIGEKKDMSTIYRELSTWFGRYSAAVKTLINRLQQSRLEPQWLMQGYELLYSLRFLFTQENLILDIGGEYKYTDENNNNKYILKHRQVPYVKIFQSLANNSNHPAIGIKQGNLTIINRGLQQLETLEKYDTISNIWDIVSEIGFPYKPYIQSLTPIKAKSSKSTVYLQQNTSMDNEVYLAYAQQKSSKKMQFYGWYIAKNKDNLPKKDLSTQKSFNFYNKGWIYEWLSSYANTHDNLNDLPQKEKHGYMRDLYNNFSTKSSSGRLIDSVKGITGGDSANYQYKFRNQTLMAKQDLQKSLLQLQGIIQALENPNEDFIQNCIKALFTNADNEQKLADNISTTVKLLLQKN